MATTANSAPLSCWQSCCLERGRIPSPPPHQSLLQGKSWSPNATAQKTRSAPAARVGTISRVGPGRSTVPHTISVMTVSAPCAHQPRAVGAAGAGVPQAHLPGASPRPLSLCSDTGLIVKVQGNATHNTVCQCQAGMHCSDTSCQTCVENQPCQRGFGFVAGESDQLLPLRETAALAALTSRERGTSPARYPWQGFGRALPMLCLAALPPGVLLAQSHSPAPPAACTDPPATSAPLQPRLWPGCHPPVSPVQKAPSPTFLLKPSRAIPGQGIV